MRRERGGQAVAPFKRGLFGIKFFYNVMGSHDGFFFPWKSVWQTKVPLSVAFLVGLWPRKDPYYGQFLEVAVIVVD
jgi:hypothetical protein